MNLVVFDIDGTLTDTHDVDSESTVIAFQNNYAGFKIDPDWSNYEHVTDNGIFNHNYNISFGRSPVQSEVDNFIDQLLIAMDLIYGTKPHFFSAIKGAENILTQVNKLDNWCVSMATGCFKRSADYKLQKACIDHYKIPAAFSEDGVSREDIINKSISRAGLFYRVSKFDNIISVGDGQWDVSTASNLDLPFIGIDCRNTGLLKSLDVSNIFNNYEDKEMFISVLQSFAN